MICITDINRVVNTVRGVNAEHSSILMKIHISSYPVKIKSIFMRYSRFNTFYNNCK